jgi:hypothetical protein
MFNQIIKAMKTLLLTVSYEDPTGKYWAESYLKNTPVKQLEGETVHDTVKRAVYDTDYCELSYKGKPQSDMFRDNKNGESRLVGYVYRGKLTIDDRNAGISGKVVNFNVWVEINEVLTPVLESCEE